MWPVFVINMKNNQTRLEKCSTILAQHGIEFERFEAIDGKTLTDAEIEASYDMSRNAAVFRHPLLRAEIGCYLSHLSIWKKLAEGDDQGVVILEDDIAITGDLAEVLRAISANTDDWDIIKLYTRRPNKKILSTQPLSANYNLVRPYNIPNTMLGYIVRKEAAIRLVKGHDKIARPVDEDHKRFWEHGLDIRMVLPPPLGLSDEAFSANSIESDRKSQSGSVLLRQGWKNLTYRLNYLARLHFHRMLGR